MLQQLLHNLHARWRRQEWLNGCCKLSYLSQGGHSPGKPGIVREFKSGQGKVRENVFLHARNLASWFSGKSLKLLPQDVRF